MIRNELKKGFCFSFENSNRFKTSMIVLNFSIALNEKNASCYSLLSEVMKRGCKTFPTYKNIVNHLIDIYSSFGCYVFKKGESLCFGVYTSFLDTKYIPESIDNFDLNVNFLIEYLFSPLIVNNRFNDDYVEQERVNLINKINEKINDKSSYSVMRCVELMCAKENYSVQSTGSVESVTNVTNDDLINAYSFLINSAPLDVYYFGSSDIISVQNHMNRLFELVPERNDNSYPISLSEDTVLESKSIIEEIEATQGNLVLGYKTNITLQNDSYPSMIVYNEILGSSPISKLFMNVREKESLCYYCGSSLDSIKGIMLICSGIDNNNYVDAVKAIQDEVYRMEIGDITEEELSCAKIALLNTYKEIYDSPFSLVNWYHTRHILNLSQTPESFSDLIQKVTLNDIISVSKNIKLELIYFLKGINNG